MESESGAHNRHGCRSSRIAIAAGDRRTWSSARDGAESGARQLVATVGGERDERLAEPCSEHLPLVGRDEPAALTQDRRRREPGLAGPRAELEDRLSRLWTEL